MSLKSPSRRNFIKYLGLATFSLPFLSTTLSALSKLGLAADVDLPPIKEGQGIAASLKYCENADKGKNKVCPTRKEKGREKQYCNNCQLYTKVKGEGKMEQGKCLLMPQGLVPAHAWCNSWVQKPGA